MKLPLRVELADTDNIVSKSINLCFPLDRSLEVDGQRGVFLDFGHAQRELPHPDLTAPLAGALFGRVLGEDFPVDPGFVWCFGMHFKNNYNWISI